MNLKLFTGHLFKVILLLIGTRLLIGIIPLLLATTISLENPLYLLSYYSYWIGNFICAIFLISFMGKFKSTSFFTGVVALFSPGLAGLFSLFLTLELFKNEE